MKMMNIRQVVPEISCLIFRPLKKKKNLKNLQNIAYSRFDKWVERAK